MMARFAENSLGQMAGSNAGRSQPSSGPVFALCAHWEYRRQPHISGRFSGRRSVGWRRLFSIRLNSFFDGSFTK